MYSTIRSKQVKGRARPAPVRTTVVLFDGGRRMRPARPFGAGLSTTRYAGQHGFMPFTAEDDAWARGLSSTTVDELDAAEDRYNEMLDHAAFEDACMERYTRGYCL